MNCLRIEDFLANQYRYPLYLEEWWQVAEELGYDTVTGMLQDMYCEKEMTIQEIASKTGFSYTSVRHKLLLMRVVRPKYYRTKKKIHRWLNIWVMKNVLGFASVDIAQEFGISTDLVYYWANLNRRK